MAPSSHTGVSVSQGDVKIRHVRRHPKTGILWFRMSIPVDVRNALGCSEIVRSLKTRDVHEAELKAELLRFDAISQIEAARKRSRRDKSGDIPPNQVRQLSAQQARAIANKWRDAQKIISYDSYLANVHAGEQFSFYMQRYLNADIDKTRDALQRGNFEVPGNLLPRLMAENGLDLEGDSLEKRMLAREILWACIEVFEFDLSLLRGERPELPCIDPAIGHSLPTSSGVPISTAFKQYVEERRLSGKTLVQAQTVIRHFVSTVTDLPIDQLTRTHFSTFRSLLLKMPV